MPPPPDDPQRASPTTAPPILFRVLQAASRYETQQRKQREKQGAQGPRTYFTVVSVVFVFSVVLFLCSFLTEYPASLRRWSLVTLAGAYVAMFCMPFVFAWRHRQHIVRMVQRPYDMIIGNASAAALVDRKYLRKIDRYPVGQLELLALELKAEKEFFERRIGLVVGAIEKLGLGPGFLAVAVSLANLSKLQSEWVTGFAYGTLALYMSGTAAHSLVMRMDRHIKLVELVISWKKTPPAPAQVASRLP